MAIVEKKVEKDARLQNTVTKQLEQRRKINHSHIGTHWHDSAKLYKYVISQEDYGFKVTMYYEYIPKTLKDRAEELKMYGKSFS